MAIDLVVVNYHTASDLEQFLESLDRYPPSSPDATLTIVEVESENYVHEFKWAGGRAGRSIGVQANIGYGRACNLGASYGTNDLVALFQADVRLTAGALDRCYNALADHPTWGVVGPRQVDSQGRIRHAGIFGGAGSLVHRGFDEPDRGQYTDVREAQSVSGSAYFVVREVWDTLTHCPQFQEVAPDADGAFLPTPHYYEDLWCSAHCWSHGYAVTYYGAVTIIHEWHRASPLTGPAEQSLPVSRDYFRAACAHHGIPVD